MSWLITGTQKIDPDAADYQQRLLVSGGSAPDSWISTVDALVIGLKNDGVWNKISDLHLFAGATTLAGACVPIKSSKGAVVQAAAALTTAKNYISSGPDLGINDYLLPLSGGFNSLSIATTALARDAAYGAFGSAAGGVNLIAGLTSFPGLFGDASSTFFAAYGYGGADYVHATSSRLAGDVILVRESASLLRCYTNGVLVGTNTGTTSTSPSSTGLGFLTGNKRGNAKRISGYFMAPGATSAEALLVRGRVATALAAMGNVNGITSFVTYGDSLTEGYNAAVPYSNYLRAYAGWSGRWVNAGTNGFRTDSSVYGATGAVNIEAALTGYRPDAYYSTRGLALLWFGTNDLRDGTAAATILSNLRTLWSTARTQGFRVIAFTIASRGDTGWTAGMETERQSLNASIIADSANWDALIRVDQLFADPNNSTYFQADKLHITSAGGEQLAATIASQINPATV